MPRFRPRLRFSLRTLFVLMTLGCLPLSWMAYAHEWIRQRNAIRERYYTLTLVSWSTNEDLTPPAPGFLWILGEPGVYGLSCQDEAQPSDAEVARIAAYFPEARLYFDEPAESKASPLALDPFAHPAE